MSGVIITKKTVLQRIIDEMMQRVLDMEDADENRIFNRVVGGSVDSLSTDMYPVCGFDQGDEEVIAQVYPFIDKNVTIIIEFRFHRQYEQADIDSYDLFRYYLGKLQERLFGKHENVTLNGLTINVAEAGSNPQIEGLDDPSPGGVLIATVTYRHVNGDPYKTPAER